jgi:high-affinity Fe2+/Pb2+ permease
MMRSDCGPALMGVMMGAMGLWMLHGAMTGQGMASGAVFVLSHVAVVIVALAAIALGLHRRLPWLGRVAAHRPSVRHFAVMLTVALFTAGVIHLGHGGPSWT